MAAMVEFAGIMVMQRRHHFKRGHQVEGNVQIFGRDLYHMEKLIVKVDGLASIGLTLSYISFNICYWVPYLMLP